MCRFCSNTGETWPVLHYSYKITFTRALRRPSLASKRKVGYFLEDRVAQTEDSQILDVKHAVMMLQTLTQVTALHQ